MLKPRRKRLTSMWNAKKHISANHTFYSGHCRGSAEFMHDLCLVSLFMFCLRAQTGYNVSLFLRCSTSCFLDSGVPLLSRDRLRLQLLAIFHRANTTKTRFIHVVTGLLQKQCLPFGLFPETGEVHTNSRQCVL